MKISYRSIDKSDKRLELNTGVYSMEYDSNCKWIWTTQRFGGIISKVDNITFSVISEIENNLTYDDIKVELKMNFLNIFKINVTGKDSFGIELDNPYIVKSDSRILGVKIIGINIDGDVIL